jgi:hypothetical protein
MPDFVKVAETNGIEKRVFQSLASCGTADFSSLFIPRTGQNRQSTRLVMKRAPGTESAAGVRRRLWWSGLCLLPPLGNLS